MNICLICYPTAGGSGVVATELAEALVDRGNEVHLVASEQPIRMQGEREGLCFHEITIPKYDLFPEASYGMAGACALMDVLKREKIDLIHAHYAFPHALSAYFAVDLMERQGPSIVTTLHGSDIYLAEEHPCHFNIVKSSLERSTRITAVSSFLKDETKRIFGGDFEIDVIPNFVDTEQFHPSSDREQRGDICSEEACLLVHVSNYRPIKRSTDMVRLLKKMIDRGQETHLLMIGDGPERGHVKGLLGEFHMREHVTFMDPVEDVSQPVSAGDFLVVTSERESFSMAALEGMACGLPVLNLAEGGIRELVRGGKDGIHVEGRDLDRLAEKAVETFGDTDRMNAMRKSARERVQDDFSEGKVVDRYTNLYRKTVRSGAGGID